MADYKSMYAKLFNSQTKAIQLLQQAQQETEDMFIEAEEPDIRLLSDLKKDDDSQYPDEEK